MVHFVLPSPSPQVVKVAAGRATGDAEACTVTPVAVPPSAHTVTWYWASWPTSTLSAVPWTVTQSWVIEAFPPPDIPEGDELVVGVAGELGLGLDDVELLGLGLGELEGGGAGGAGSAWHAVFPDV